MSVRIGVLALQGSFSEHVDMLKKMGVEQTEVRVAEDLVGCDGLIFPGGESTAMALIGEKCGIFPALREWVQSGRPVWGTCAGMILLSNNAIFQREGGQALVGGLEVEVCRNFFGSQVQSFEMELDVGEYRGELETPASNAVFIRAPAIMKVGPDVHVLAKVKARPSVAALAALKASDAAAAAAKDAPPPPPQSPQSSVESTATPSDDGENFVNDFKRHTPSDVDMTIVGLAPSEAPRDVIVAVRQGHLMATAFHPEYTNDPSWHQYFLSIVAEANAARQPDAAISTSA